MHSQLPAFLHHGGRSGIRGAPRRSPEDPCVGSVEAEAPFRFPEDSGVLADLCEEPEAPFRSPEDPCVGYGESLEKFCDAPFPAPFCEFQ